MFLSLHTLCFTVIVFVCHVSYNKKFTCLLRCSGFAIVVGWMTIHVLWSTLRLFHLMTSETAPICYLMSELKFVFNFCLFLLHSWIDCSTKFPLIEVPGLYLNNTVRPPTCIRDPASVRTTQFTDEHLKHQNSQYCIYYWKVK